MTSQLGYYDVMRHPIIQARASLVRTLSHFFAGNWILS